MPAASAVKVFINAELGVTVVALRVIADWAEALARGADRWELNVDQRALEALREIQDAVSAARKEFSGTPHAECRIAIDVRREL